VTSVTRKSKSFLNPPPGTNAIRSCFVIAIKTSSLNVLRIWVWNSKKSPSIQIFQYLQVRDIFKGLQNEHSVYGNEELSIDNEVANWHDLKSTTFVI
jgi:hypothetical protein